ncbi:hypothetical protein HBO12_25680 [Pseudomonas sp. WS 5059]|uniref:hypothetical protein n=1 Tax=Pseudomonas sp. WS 5059 TaxID=2717491 RepID=UPI001472F78D|nr:hypothetical protein [Pseudomonas sp. WS 5059]NMY06352.1 hypothetical protein [Pseudomonas sp. WS 5059]
MRSFNLIDRLLGRKPEIEKAYAAALRGEAFTLEPGMKIIEVPRHPEAERIAASIRDYPEDWAWTMKGYKLIHTPSGFVLWVANKDYGLAEVYSNGGKGDFSKPEQEIIWPAVEGWLARHKVGFTGRPVKPRIRYFRARYFCESSEHPWRGFGHTADEAYQSWLAAVSAQYRERIPKNVVLTVWSAANE